MVEFCRKLPLFCAEKHNRRISKSLESVVYGLWSNPFHGSVHMLDNSVTPVTCGCEKKPWIR